MAFRGDNASSDLTGYYTHFYIYPGECYVYGNIMSLLYTTELPTRTTLSRATIFKGLFSDSQYGERLYSHPTQKLLLPATTLASGCYQEMFYGCYNLTTAPVMNATTLAPYCYMQMFSGCSSLNSVKCLATSMSANNCTTEWLRDVASTGTFTKAAGVTWSTGESGIPENWTVVEE